MSQHKSIRFLGENRIPSKIVCVGRNYLAHIQELGNSVPSEPVIFLKPNSAIGDSLYSYANEDIHFEGELCFLIQNGKITGVGFGLDLTKRTLQTSLKSKGLPWERAKSFDNAAVFSDFVPIPTSLQGLSLALTIDGSLTQQGAYDLMIYKPAELVAHISEFMTFADNDIVMTGTPSGVGIVKQGQVFKGEVLNEGISLVIKEWTAL
jgi:2-keto-4-pentenoate hydratase/2-oxohepta-3-ene-1,7-dioic acid hydratase in catechol pathway